MSHYHANEDWTNHVKATELCRNSYTTEEATLAVLMDVRQELRRLNELLHCLNFIDIPTILRRIDSNTKKPKRKRATR